MGCVRVSPSSWPRDGHSEGLSEPAVTTLRTLPLPDGVPGRAWLSDMPGRAQPWPQFLAEAADVGVTRVVCLTPRHEIASVSPAYRDALDAGDLPFAWQHMPLRDYGLALEPQAFRDAIEGLAARLRAGESVLLHCAAGIGRTGTVAACLLKCLGWPTPQALQQVRAAGSNPQSALQSGVIELF